LRDLVTPGSRSVWPTRMRRLVGVRAGNRFAAPGTMALDRLPPRVGLRGVPLCRTHAPAGKTLDRARRWMARQRHAPELTAHGRQTSESAQAARFVGGLRCSAGCIIRATRSSADDRRLVDGGARVGGDPHARVSGERRAQRVVGSAQAQSGIRSFASQGGRPGTSHRDPRVADAAGVWEERTLELLVVIRSRCDLRQPHRAHR
jgi:hypothetical protein